MSDLLCPFSAPLVKKDFGCTNAQEIIRRGGAEIACLQANAHATCIELHSAVKSAALTAMDYEDDLLTLPHSVLVKIQYGGLLGIQGLMADKAQHDDGVENIASLVSAVVAQFASIDQIPLESVSGTISRYKVQRQRKK